MESTDPTHTPESQKSSAPAPPPGTSGSSSGAGRTVAVIAGGIISLFGAVLVLGGLALIAAHAFVRDDGGFYTSGKELIESDGAAVATQDIDLGDLGGGRADLAPEDGLGTLRVRAESTAGGPVFVGIAPRKDVQEYLARVAHSELTDFGDGAPTYDQQPGRASVAPPQSQEFWAATASGSGEQALEWDFESGHWSVVLMNADAQPGVAVDADVGVEIGWLIWVGVGLALIGIAITVGGVILITKVGRRRTTSHPGIA